MNVLQAYEIVRLDPEEFEDELNGSFGVVESFRPFLEPQVVERTIEYLINLRDSLDGQLKKYTGIVNEDPEWIKRTQGLRHLVSSRLHMAQGRVRSIRKETEGGSDALSKWKRFGHKLIELLVELETDAGEVWPELDEIETPFGGLTARQWLTRRLEKDPTRTGVNA